MDTTKLITKQAVAKAVCEAIPNIACVLPCDVKRSLAEARKAEGESRGALVLDQLLENAEIAERDCVPICQDTGTCWVCLEAGPDVLVLGDVFAETDDAVARAYTEALLRKSVVRDAFFDRANTGDNTPLSPIFISAKSWMQVACAAEGGGSDNASRCGYAAARRRQSRAFLMKSWIAFDIRRQMRAHRS